ncbi:hypothetical protein PanWU01x14_359200 [Parasponia andersonii]|uniref:Uncharacterized protein n=1 Tax=Parasponia andersonii TaxID=3476 RepID=A0A2P5A826_PARAD|nr:hypothetical protein PanWU01x14_359200 [Parasponia andersonii]
MAIKCTCLAYTIGRIPYIWWGQYAENFRLKLDLSNGIFQPASPFEFVANSVCSSWTSNLLREVFFIPEDEDSIDHSSSLSSFFFPKK